MKKTIILLLFCSNVFAQNLGLVGLIGTNEDTIQARNLPPSGFFKIYANLSSGSLFMMNNIGVKLRLIGNGKGNVTSNFVVGNSGLALNTTGSNNTAVGYALAKNTVGTNNTGFGYGALNNNTTASDNVAIGKHSSYNSTTGFYNTIIGTNAGFSLTTGGSNVVVGRQSGANLGTGGNNVLIGSSSGANLVNGNRNVFIGDGAGSTLTSASDRLIISNSNTLTPLIEGYFSSPTVIVNGDFRANNVANCTRFWNVTIQDSTTFTHNLGTLNIDVRFFENGVGGLKKEVNFIDYTPTNTFNSITVYLPYRDKPTKYKFVGDVFITKRD